MAYVQCIAYAVCKDITLETRVRFTQELEVAKRERNKLADINKVKSDIAELVSYLQQTAEEITEPDVVRKDVFAISQ